MTRGESGAAPSIATPPAAASVAFGYGYNEANQRIGMSAAASYDNGWWG